MNVKKTMIRLITIEDVQRVNELYFALFKLTSETEPYYHKPTYQNEDFLKSVVDQHNGFVGYVYEKDDLIIGFVIAQLQASPPYECFKQLNAVYLMDIVVDEHYRGHGIGAKLMNKVKDWGLQNEVDYLELSVLAKNEKAYQLYLREGFVPYNISMRSKLK